MTIRRATEADLDQLSDLCQRSKAVWGYDADFMEACRDELTLRPEELETSSIAVAAEGGKVLAMVQVEVREGIGDLSRLYVDPNALRSGLGRSLFEWSLDEVRRLGATRLTIEADPNAVSFYEKMGARVIGSVPSGSIAGRRLPQLAIDLA